MSTIREHPVLFLIVIVVTIWLILLGPQSGTDPGHLDGVPYEVEIIR